MKQQSILLVNIKGIQDSDNNDTHVCQNHFNQNKKPLIVFHKLEKQLKHKTNQRQESTQE